ncbi:MAG: hypothetical protein V4543_17785 [Bacteroidota bacterium]
MQSNLIKNRIILLSAMVLSIGCWFMWLKPGVIALLAGHKVFLLTYIAETLYPRLTTELQRLPAAFFIDKAGQVILRLNMFIAACWAASELQARPKSSEAIRQWWHKPVSVKKLTIAVKVFYGLLLFFSVYFLPDIAIRSLYSAFRDPVPLWKALHIPAPSLNAVFFRQALICIGCLYLIFFRMKAWVAIGCTLLFLLWQGELYSLGKMDHTFATFTYLAMLMPVLVYQIETAAKTGKLGLSGWVLQLIRIAVVCGYFFSGLEKLLISGPSWASADTFLSYIHLHEAPIGAWVAGKPVLYTVLPVFALIFQLSFPVGLLKPKWAFYYIVAGIGFHWGTYLLLNAGGWLSPWITVYYFLPDFYKLNQK